ncbi:MAG: IS3 family transposase [Dehalococcoidia bacterium]|nr:IS3 family transposase [Dehalococcoidia bacterium]
MQQTHGLSERRACGLVGMARSSQSYQPRQPEDAVVRDQLRQLAMQWPRFGYPRLTALLRRQGLRVNHKRVYRLYGEEALAVRRRRRKQVARARRIRRVLPTRPNERWSLDFMADSLVSGRVFRTLSIVDDWSRESLAITVDTSLPGARVMRVLEALYHDRGLPERIVLDNGPELRSRSVDQWATARGVVLDFITPGKPMENAYVESLNGKFRDECLNQHWFASLAKARELIEAWRQDYNERRPHSALDYQTPAEFVATATRPGLSL